MNFKQRDSNFKGKKPAYAKSSGNDSRFKSDRGNDSRFKSDRGNDSRFTSDRGNVKDEQKSSGTKGRSSAGSSDSGRSEKFNKKEQSQNVRSNRNEQTQHAKFNKKPVRELFIWGRRTVEAFLSNLHQQAKEFDNSKYALHIIVDKSQKAPSQLKPAVESAQLLGIKIVPHESAAETWPLADSSEELNHQRICLKIPEYPTQFISEAVDSIKAANEQSHHGCIGLVLDQIQDPRNFGAIIRSAAFFGVKFVVYGTDRQADITSLVLKTSAGGAFSIALIPAVNINRTLQQLKEAGAWIVGTALGENSSNLKDLPKDRAWVAVLGNEEKGLRNEVLKNCDYVAQIPGGKGTVDSLNVSVAAGVLIHSLN